MKKKYEVVGFFWNEKSWEIIKINNRLYVLNERGWNGEAFYECFEVKDNKGYETVSEIEYIIKPIYSEEMDGEYGEDFVIIDYEITEE